MARPLSNQPPRYCLFKPRGLAYVRLDGKNHYLGKWQSPESYEAYARAIAGWTSGQAPAPQPSTAPTLTVGELIDAYKRRRVAIHYLKDGRPTSEQDNIAQALRFLDRLYGSTPAGEFAPLALKRVREAMIDAGRSRKLINGDVHRIRQMFRWAVGEELSRADQLAALKAVEPLERGRSRAKERPPVRPVDLETIRATIAECSPQVKAMVMLQLLAAMRPGEVMALRPRLVDRTDPTAWVYRPAGHKTEHHDKDRVVVLGPKAQGWLEDWLLRDPGMYCFSPAEVIEQRDRAGLRSGASSVARPKAGGRYSAGSYCTAIKRATERAFPHEAIEAIGPRWRTAEQRAELRAWRKAHHWHPNRLRHTAATMIRSRKDLEAAQVVLGHSKPDTTLIYAERDLERAKALMRQIG